MDVRKLKKRFVQYFLAVQLRPFGVNPRLILKKGQGPVEPSAKKVFNIWIQP